MLSVIIVIVIIILSVILAGIGAYVVIHSADEKEEVKPVIDVSGKYAVVVRPARESITAVKPSENSIRAWLETQEQLTPEQRKEYLDKWNASIEETIKTIDDGDQNGTVTYRIELGPKGKEYVKFVHEENFITREQIRNHAEIAALGKPEQVRLESGRPHPRKLLRRPRLEASCVNLYFLHYFLHRQSR